MDERTIFLAALEKDDPRERAKYLDEVCRGDPLLRGQVETLLRASRDAGSFLEGPPAGLVATIAAGQFDATDDEAGKPALDFLTSYDKPGCLGKLAQYEVIELVGSGGMGLVLRAFDPKLNRVVAIKVLRPEFAANPMAVKRFLREAKAAAAVSHDHVVTIHHIHDSHRPPFLVMEFVDGQSLQQKIDRTGALDLTETLRIGLQTASGLAAAHKQGLVHRDIKPANILLENGVERVKITDFGLARAADDVSVTQTGQIAGTPQYMSPEQAQGRAVDARSDLFSLGSVLYALCTGRPPFRGDSAVAMLRRVCDDDPRPIRQVNPEIPAWLEAIIGKLLAKHPDDRFQSAEEVADLLSRHLAHLQHPTTAPMPAAVAPAVRRGDDTRPQQVKTTVQYLWATGLLSLVWAVLGVAAVVAMLFGGPARAGWLFVVSGAASLPVASVVLLSAWQAERRRSYGWALTGTIVSLAPVNLWLLVLLPGTLFKLVRLWRRDVREAFTGAPPGEEFPSGQAAAELPPQKPGPWKAAPCGLLWGRAVFLLAMIAIAGFTFAFWFFATNYGTVRVEVADPNAKVLLRCDRDQIIEIADYNVHLRVPAGEFTLHIKHGDLEFETDRFRIRRGEDVLVRVERIEGRLAARVGEQIIGRAPSADDATSSAAAPLAERMAPEAVFQGFDGYPTAIAFAPDGGAVLAGDDGGHLRICDLTTRKISAPIPIHAAHVWTLVFSPDGKLLGSGAADGSVKLWKVEGETVQLQAKLQGHTNHVWRLSFSPDGSLVAACSDDKTVRVWKVESGESAAVLKFEDIATSVEFSPDGRTLAAGHYYLSLWDTRSWKELSRSQVPTPLPRLRFAKDGAALFTAGSDKLIKRWPLPDLDLPTATWAGHEEWIEDLRLSPDGTLLASVGGDWSWPDPEKPDKIRLWDVASGRQVAAFDGHQSVARQVVFSPDDARFATCSRDGTVKVWRLPKSLWPAVAEGDDDAETAPPRHVVNAEWLFTGKHDAGITAVAISKDGEQALTGHFNGAVCLWDVASVKAVHSFEQYSQPVYDVLFWPDGRHALTGSEDGAIRLWDLETKQEVRQFAGHTGRVERLALSPDGRFVLSSSADYAHQADTSVRLWDAASREERRRLTGQTLYTRDLVFSQDGRDAYGADVLSVLQWELATGRPVYRFTRFPTAPLCLALSPDGRLLALGYAANDVRDDRWHDPDDCLVRLWDLASRSVIREFRGHTGPILDVAFTPDGRRLLTVADGRHDEMGKFVTSSDQSVRLWDVSSGRELVRYATQERVQTLAVMPDGQSFLTGGDSLRLWRVDATADATSAND